MYNLIMKSSTCRTPFHPVRLINFLDKIFFLEMEDFAQPEDEEEDDDKKGDKENVKEQNGDEAVDETNPNYRLFGNASIEERDQKNEEQIKYMKENYGHIIRSKGFMWMAGMLSYLVILVLHRFLVSCRCHSCVFSFLTVFKRIQKY